MASAACRHLSHMFKADARSVQIPERISRLLMAPPLQPQLLAAALPAKTKIRVHLSKPYGEHHEDCNYWDQCHRQSRSWGRRRQELGRSHARFPALRAEL